MPTTFIKSQTVRIKAVIPEGPVQALRMTEDGEFYYLIHWTDVNGVEHSRWFKEEDLEAA